LLAAVSYRELFLAETAEEQRVDYGLASSLVAAD